MATRLGKVAKEFKNGNQPSGGSEGGIYGKYRQLLRDSPLRWVIIVVSIAYLLSPIDFIPDFIPFVGFIDDGVVACILLHEIVLMVVDGYQKRKETKAQQKAQEAAQPLLPGPRSAKSGQVAGQSMYPSKYPSKAADSMYPAGDSLYPAQQATYGGKPAKSSAAPNLTS